MAMQLSTALPACRPQITFRSCGISMNNGITGDNDLNLALDVTAGQMNYSSITNSSTCFIVRGPTAFDDLRFIPCCICIAFEPAYIEIDARAGS